MKILRNLDTADSFLLQNGEEILKVNLLLNQIAYFKRETAISEMVFLNDWAEIDSSVISEVTILRSTKRLLEHLQVTVDESVKLFNCTDDPNCFLIIGSGKIIQVDKKFNSLSDECDSLFLESRYDLSRPETHYDHLIAIYHEILNYQSGCMLGLDLYQKVVY